MVRVEFLQIIVAISAESQLQISPLIADGQTIVHYELPCLPAEKEEQTQG